MTIDSLVKLLVSVAVIQMMVTVGPAVAAAALLAVALHARLHAAIPAPGRLLGGWDEGSRKTLSLTTALRNIAVGLVIATDAFAGTPAVTAVLAYGIVGVLGSLLIAWGWGRKPGRLPG